MRPKDIGTAAETAVTRAARAFGFAQAERRALAGSADLGDVLLCPGVIVEVKAGKQTESPSDAQVTAWWAETVVESVNANADVALLVLRRHGKGDALAWWCWMDLDQLCGIAISGETWPALPRTLVRVRVDDALRLLRAQGWGDPL